MSVAEGALTTTLRKFVGSCTNGVAFLTATNTVAKFTIDEQESVLWGQLWGKKHQNIAQCYGSWQLASRESGETIVYLVHVEFVPYPITGRLAELMRLVSDSAWKAINTTPVTANQDKTVHNNRMTMAHIRALRAAAQEDQRLAQLIDLLVDLTDMGVYIYDLQPDNFRLGNDNKIKLIDPSTPIGAKGRPQKLVFESRRFRGIGVGHIIF